MTKSELILEQFRRYANSADIMSKLHSREILSGYGNSELNCIDCIGRMKHPNAARIADEMDLTRSAVSKILRKLIAKDAAISYQLPGNQKEIYYKLTPYGRELFRQHRLRHLNWEQRDREFFDSLDPVRLPHCARIHQRLQRLSRAKARRRDGRRRPVRTHRRR